MFASSTSGAMEPKTFPVEMFFFPFFPFVGGGHQIPMIDAARVFAAHGAKSTIITTPSNALHFQKSIARDQQSGHPITIHALSLPENAELPDTDMSAAPFTDTSILQEPLKQLLIQHPPDCIIIDAFHRWAADTIDELQITRIIFNGNGCFPRCVQENIKRYGPHQKVGSDWEPFVVPGLPDRIELKRSQLAGFFRHPSGFPDRMKKSEEKSFGTVINSFYDLEPAYADNIQIEMGKKAWLIGPVSLCNRNTTDKAERGKLSTIDEQSCLNWLNCKEPNSVLYISFGSLARLVLEQLWEIAYGLEATGCSFIWVVGKIFNSSKNEIENWFPSGFEQKMRESNKGLIIRGWAPQLLILEHAAVGVFMTHCGWNSTLEGISAGVPIITWPLSAEQFYNEKLITDVVRIGVQVGSEEWKSWNERQALVGREKIEVAVKMVMGDSEEMVEMRMRAKDNAGKARRAVEVGGTSYNDADTLIEDLKALRQRQKC